MHNPFRNRQPRASQPPPATVVPASEPLPAAPPAALLPLDLAPNDPLAAYLLSASGPVDLERLELDSAALRALKAAGVRMVAPLVGQGELIGLLNVGPRRSEQDYSSDDRRLLGTLAAQAAPAVRVAQLVRQQQIEAQARERLEQELRVARVIQQTLLPKDVPTLAGWHVAAHWQPARAVSGDFYDFIALPDGRLAVVIADVTDKGVPAALVMAAARSMLRMASEQHPGAPGKVLERVNDLLCPNIPPNMFVTCLYSVLDPASGHLVFANAGHNLPAKRTATGVAEVRATGMPLGLLPGMTYDEQEDTLAPGESILLYSDGLVEAHDPGRAMFGFPRLRELVAHHAGGAALIGLLRAQLVAFTGPHWEQEDDVTLVTLERNPLPVAAERDDAAAWQPIASLSIASAPGNERDAMEQVAAAVGQHFPWAAGQLAKLKTAVAEATMNAMEHGNRYQPDRPVQIQVLAGADAVRVDITDEGGGHEIPATTAPDLEAKLEGLQSPRGWGLFLIKNMADDMAVFTDGAHHTIALTFALKGATDANRTL